MKTSPLLFSFCILLFAFCSLHSLPAFPGAEGWGAETRGGRGGKVYIVTNTNTTGPGSFHEALWAKEPRIIVFAVSGRINIQTGANASRPELDSTHAYVTIAGQTSPAGVTFYGSGSASLIWCYQSDWHEFIWRHLRFRANNDNLDGVTISSAHHFIIDHCDFSGGSDESMDVTRDHDFTIQYSTIANCAGGDNMFTYGILLGYQPTYHVSLHHTLIANHQQRFPEFYFEHTAPFDNGRIDYRNNLCYNGYGYFISMADRDEPATNGTAYFNIVGNYFKGGPGSPPNATEGSEWYWSLIDFSGIVSGYEEDNVMEHKDGRIRRDRVRERTPNRVDIEWAMPPVATHSSDSAYEVVLREAGAWPRDSMNRRTVNEVRTGTGSYGNYQAPQVLTGPPAPADADMDGMPDFWEDGVGLDKNSAADNTGDLDGDGYTNIEEYINDLANARMCKDYFNPVYPIPTDWPDYNPACCKSLAAVESPDRVKNILPSISVRPSPVTGTGVLFLNGINPEKSRIQILDARGKQVAAFDAGQGQSWNSAGAAAGVYLVRVLSNGKQVARKKITVLH
jgi:pectate lyase